MSSSCMELAANLSGNYLSPAVYDGISPLADYLSVTGVLLSLCLFENCTTSINSFDHISGSWLQHSTTGPRIYGNGFLPGGGVGMVLDPQRMDIRCLYPLNGDTAPREQQGCGPMNFDWYFNWWSKSQIKSTVYWRKYTQFWGKKWQDIPCSQLLQGLLPLVVDIRSPLMIDKQQTWISYLDWVQQVFARVVFGLNMICYDDLGPDFDVDYEKLGYDGDEPWWPSEWNENVAVTEHVISQHPTDLGIWNEIVMKQLENETSNNNYSDFVQAVFYLNLSNNPNNYDLARKEARLLGIEHVLEFDFQSADGTLFKCPPSDESSSSSSLVAD